MNSNTDSTPLQLMDERELPDAIKVSICNTCEGVVRAAVNKYLKDDLKAKNEFMREVMKYNLSVKEMPLSKYKEIGKWCECK